MIVKFPESRRQHLALPRAQSILVSHEFGDFRSEEVALSDLGDTESDCTQVERSIIVAMTDFPTPHADVQA